MGKQRTRKFAPLMVELRRECELAASKLTSCERLREAPDLSNFCLKLAAKGRELRAT